MGSLYMTQIQLDKDNAMCRDDMRTLVTRLLI
jgi:hypothetical protein